MGAHGESGVLPPGALPPQSPSQHFQMLRGFLLGRSYTLSSVAFGKATQFANVHILCRAMLSCVFALVEATLAHLVNRGGDPEPTKGSRLHMEAIGAGCP